MRIIRLFFLLGLLVSLMSFFSCRPHASELQKILTDSLNLRAYESHYRNLDTTLFYAQKALASSHGYHTGMAEAMNNIAFYKFMKMDFVGARKQLEKVYSTTNNELELLVADISMMKICQRTSVNKEFYDYRNRALERMARIQEERNYLKDRERKRFIYAESEFHIVSSVYYYYLQQDKQSMKEILKVDPDGPVKEDVQQLLQLYYMKGSGGMCEGDNFRQITLKEFDYLVSCIQLAQTEGYVYFQANAMQAFAEMLLDSSTSRALWEYRMSSVRSFRQNDEPDSMLALTASQRALSLFKVYDDYYQIAGTYRTIAECLFEQGSYNQSLDTLQRALDYVNLHHTRYYHCSDSTHLLALYRPNEKNSLEMEWLNGGKILTVSEWIARLREQISMTYSALGMKAQSDYNRNIYLDILDVTRQDKELENRYETLENENRQINFWTSLMIVGILLVALLLWVANVTWKKRNHIYIKKVKLALEICQKVTSCIPADVQNLDQVVEVIEEHVSEDFVQLFGDCHFAICLQTEDVCDFPLHLSDDQIEAGVTLAREKKLSKDERALMRVIIPYLEWTLDNALVFQVLGEQRKQVEKEKYVYEQHIVDNKRENLNKEACMSLVNDITPFLNRIINEVGKLESSHNGSLRKERYLYIRELTDRINEYNDILAMWIKMKQGTLSLHVESFGLEEVFDIVEKGRKSFEMKGLQLDIHSTDAVVKADKALTLFMLNTLMENARKYTPAGGHVSVEALETDTYVELAVKDDGPGLHPDDVKRILGEKVYDSSKIGIYHTESDASILKNKGYGFGLINCKGIIEKYRKNGSLFAVCSFLVESERGKGSRFGFRLPKVVRTLCLLLMMTLGFISCTSEPHAAPSAAQQREAYDSLMTVASGYADSAYYSNVYGHYASALVFADSALQKVNAYMEKRGYVVRQSRLKGRGMAAEIEWFDRQLEMDYYILLDVRNEAAVAALALQNWNLYRYNNSAYTTLYKLVSEDSNLNSYCRKMQASSTNKRMILIVSLLSLLLFLFLYYLIYFRQRILYRLNLEQVLEINKEIFACTSQNQAAESQLKDIPERIVHAIFPNVSSLRALTGLGIGVFDDESKKMIYAFSDTSEFDHDWLRECMEKCFADGRSLTSSDRSVSCYPLRVELGEEQHCIGVWALVHAGSSSIDRDALLFGELVTRYLGIAIWNAMIRMSHSIRELEDVEDEKRRALFEENQLHVQNQVLDNCFSTLKHETLYYPTRITQIVDKLSQCTDADQEKEWMSTLSQLAYYYKDVFTLLSTCANRQLEEITFRRTRIPCRLLADKALAYLKKVNRKKHTVFTLEVEASDLDVYVVGDVHLLGFLLENLIDNAVRESDHDHVAFKLILTPSGSFMKFSFIHPEKCYTTQQLNELFYPQLKRMTEVNGTLQGIELLLCKQIIRDHDQYMGHKGCRIVAEEVSPSGYSIWWTIPC